MNLSDVYQEGGIRALRTLAEATGANVQYLRQCATNWRGKRPSPELARLLIQADPRLTYEAMYRQSAPEPQERAA